MELTYNGGNVPATKKGWVEMDGKRMFLKSNWERRFCLYLSLMKKYGHIVDYWYEPDTFWFGNIKRGTNNYKPDFKAMFPSGNSEFYEVKGHATAKDFTKWKRMTKYHPQIKLNIIDKEWFNNHSKILKKVFRDW